MAADDHLPCPRKIISAHDEIEEAYDLKFRGARVAAPRLVLQKILQEVTTYEDVWMRVRDS